MNKASTMRKVRIGEGLKDFGYIDDDALNQALAYQKEHRGVRLGQALITLGFITEDQLLIALSHHLDVPIVDISAINVDIEAVRLIPEDVARQRCSLATEVHGNVLTIVTNDPVNFFGLEEIRQITGKTLDVALCKRSTLDRAIDYYYREVSTFLRAEDASLGFAGFEALEDLVFDIDVESEGDAPIVNLLNSLVHHAYRAGASDIHIEPFQETTSVRIRVDGVIVDYLTIKRSVHSPLITRIKIVSDMDIAERYLPQDGHFRMNIGGEPLNIRVSVIPTVFGEKAVLRLLSGNTAIAHNATYGMRQDDYERFCRILRTPNGIIYITGPTGSGKTTTLYMLLAALSNEQVNISTIEDPVEHNLPRVNQVQVNETAGLTFEVGLRSLMRQDPDIIMLGETRDTETANIAVRAAITGHLVLSTLHTNDAASTIHRLVDIGVEPYMVASSLAGVVAQRLMRKICPECSEERPATESELKMLGLGPGESAAIHIGKGCHHCNQTGYKGRIAIHEILVVDKEIRHMIAEATLDDRVHDYAVREQGMKTLQDAAAQAVLDGLTTPEEFLKIVYQV